jgi:HSP20 family protein
MICHFCPSYEIHDNAKMFQVSIHVAGFKTKDMKVDIEQCSRNLHVTGERKVQNDNVVFQTSFDKRFALSENVDTTKITAKFAEGVLVVEAPKRETEEEKVTSITITDLSLPSRREVNNQKGFVTYEQ